MKIINPANNQLIKEIADDTNSSIRQKYLDGKAAQLAWKATAIKERLACILKFQARLEENMEELSKILTSEVGKPLDQSRGEINGAIERIQFFLDHSEKWLAEEVISDDNGMTEKIIYEPLGVIANISAWNYPYLVGVNVFIPALIGGNSVLYKPSEYATLTGLRIEKLMRKSGLPSGVFQVVTGGKASGDALLELPLDGYFFTGSYQTGQYIYEKVAKKMVPCQLELGGKDPMYITDDNIDIRKTAEIAADGVFYNNGQSCCAVERIYVHEKIYEAFISSFLEIVQSYKIGEPMVEGNFIGPLTRKPQISVLEDQVKDALNKGAKLHTGGHSIEGEGYFFHPTVLTNVDHNMKLMKEESFGPIIGIQKVSNDEEAIQMMQDTTYGLTSAVVTDDRERAEAILYQMDSGSVYWNCCDRVSANLPWTGRKHSGIGSTLSYQGIRAFVKPKSYHLRQK